MPYKDTVYETVRDRITVPPHIQNAANACLFDLMNGPSWSRIPGGDITRFTDDMYESLREDVEGSAEPGDVIEETYTGQVGNAVRDFIGDLPFECWVDIDSGEFFDREPQVTFTPDEEGPDEDGDGNRGFLDDPYACGSICHVDHHEIIAALFGNTFAREFR